MRGLGIDPWKDPVSVHSRVGYLPGELNLDSNLTVKGALYYFNDLRGNKCDWDYACQLSARLKLNLHNSAAILFNEGALQLPAEPHDGILAGNQGRGQAARRH